MGSAGLRRNLFYCCTGHQSSDDSGCKTNMTFVFFLFFFSFLNLSGRLVKSFDRNGFDSIISVTVMDDRRGDEQGETGALTQRGLRLEQSLKSPD